MKQLACLVALLLPTSAFAQVQTRAPLRQELALRDQQVLSVVQIVQDATSTPIAIESPAAARAACAHITVAAPAGASVSSVLAALGQSLQAVGLRLEVARGRAYVQRVPNTPEPAHCQAPSTESPPARRVVGDDGDATDPATRILEAGIHSDSPFSYRITRTVRDLYFDDPAVAQSGVRIVPRQTNGTVIGAALYGIRFRSPFALLGFRNGDVITTINGSPIASLLTIPLVLPESVRHGDHIVVVILRGGLPVTLEWQVVERL